MSAVLVVGAPSKQFFFALTDFPGSTALAHGDVVVRAVLEELTEAVAVVIAATATTEAATAASVAAAEKTELLEFARGPMFFESAATK